MKLDYEIIFQRNYGIFDENDQERIRHTHVLIVGDSGVGETIAIILARSGVEKLVIVGVLNQKHLLDSLWNYVLNLM